MFQLNLIAILFIFNTLLIVHSDNRSASYSTASCPPIKLLHGRIKYRNKMTQAKFLCNRSYILAGERFAICRRGVWDNGRPVCVKTTCPKVNPPHNAIMYPAYNGGVLNFYCKPGYELRGPGSSFCDGLRWNTSLPSCLLTNTLPALSCDFETPDLCGWSQDMNHNFDWKRENFETSRGHIETGPKYDHDNNTGGFGYYMYIESASRRENDTARLISPIYNKNENGLCFTFYYHMYGVGTGQLRVYAKKISDSYDLRQLTPEFVRSGNQGDYWRRGSFFIDYIDDDFQIIIEGVRGAQIESDIAIDDVQISDYCDDVESSTMLDSSSEPIPVYESCQDRCGQSTESNPSYINCDCSDNCMENNSCCPDYIAYCILDATTDYSEDTEEVSSTLDPTQLPTNPTSTIKPKSNPIIVPVKPKVNPIIVTVKPKVNPIIVTVTPKVNPILISVKPKVNPISSTVKHFLTTTNSPKTNSTIIQVLLTTKPIPNPTKSTRIYPISTKTTKIYPKITVPTTVWLRTTQKPKISTTPHTTSSSIKTQTTIKTTQTPIKNKIPMPKINNENNSEKVKIVKKFIGPRVKPTTAQIEDSTDAVQTPQIETDYEQNQTQTIDPFAQMSLRHSEAKHGEGHWTIYFIIEIIAGSLSLALVTIIGVVLKRKFRLGCPGFKKQRYSESMSDVRFLAGDEALDFSWRQPDN